MDAEGLLDNFEKIASAPDGVGRLRELILQVAVHGKLVQQDPSEGSARDVLKSIAKSGEVDRAAAIDVFPTDLNSIPASWEWVRLRDVTRFDIGRTPKTKVSEYWSADGVPWVSIADMPAGGTVTATKKRVSRKAVEEVFKTPAAGVGTLLMSFKLTIGKVALLGVSAFHNEAIVSLRPRFPELRDYLFKILPVVARGGKTKNAIKGKTLNKASLGALPIPFPPLAEQRRIVARVEKLTALCDELEARQERRKAVRKAAQTSALEALSSADGPHAFARAWDRVRANWEALTAHPDSIPPLRQAILQLAVQGKLLKQDPKDRPASSILAALNAEDDESSRTSSRSRTTSTALSAEELAFLAPPGWTWARFGDIADIAGGVTKGRNLAGRRLVSWPYLRVANVQAGYLDLARMKEIEIPVEELERYELHPGDVLLTEGGDWDKLGRSAVWQGEISPCAHQNHVFRARPRSADLQSDWLSPIHKLPTWSRLFSELREADHKSRVHKYDTAQGLPRSDSTRLRAGPDS